MLDHGPDEEAQVTSAADAPGAALGGATGAGSRRMGGVRSQLGLATLLVVLFLTFLDNTIISVTLAAVQSSLHAGVTQLQWVVDAYALVFAAFMLSAGTLGDLFGRKKVMLGGVLVFCTGSLIGALAVNSDMLIGARVVMGLGAAASEPGTLSMIRHLYPDAKVRARALGAWAAVSGLALAMGPVIGGVLVGVYSWRAVFWFNLFFGLVAMAGAAAVLPETSDRVGAHLDTPGLVLGAGALSAVTYATIAGESSGYLIWWIDLLFAAAVVLGTAFVWVELRAENPVLNLRYFRRKMFAGSNLVAFCTYFGTFSIFFFVALYLQVVGSTTGYGLALDFLPMAVGMILSSLIAGRWVSRSGPRIPMTLGCVLAGTGMLLTDWVLTPTSGISTLGWSLLLAGIGIGIVVVPVTASALSSIPAEHSGMAASMTNTSRELGAVTGVAVLGSLVNGLLITSLVKRLTELGIPKQFQDQVVAAVTTGTFNGQSSAAAKRYPGLAKMVTEVEHAAWGAFSTGVDWSLAVAGVLMLCCAVLAAFTMRASALSIEEALAGSGEHPQWWHTDRRHGRWPGVPAPE
jgi:EmrB/QacA subfamily drug resistance transporter